MAIEVRCRCGALVTVPQGQGATTFRCPSCGGGINAAEASAAFDGPLRPPPLPPGAAAGRACRVCGTGLPEGEDVCLFCGEAWTPRPAEAVQMLTEAVATLDAHVADANNLAADAGLRGCSFSAMSVVLALVTLGCLLMVAVGVSIRRHDGSAALAFGGGFLMPVFGIALLVSWGRDWAASHIQTAGKPTKALQRYFAACRTGRSRKAYAALAPSGRRVAAARPPRLEKVPSQAFPMAISDWRTFSDYYRLGVFRGPSPHVRRVVLRKVRLRAESTDGRAWVGAEVDFSSYNGLLMLLVLANLLIALIAILIATKRERKQITKLLIRRGGRWYVAHGEFEGPLDRVDPAALGSAESVA